MHNYVISKLELNCFQKVTCKICTFVALYFTVTAQESPSIVIAHPGQNVELLCTLGIPSSAIQLSVAWTIEGPNFAEFEGVNALSNGILTGYSANVNKSLIVENIVMNDRRNDTQYQCVFIISGTMTIVNRSDPIFLFVAGKYMSVV